MAIILYKKRKRFVFKDENFLSLIKILGYDLKKKRFKYHNKDYRYFSKNTRYSRQWRQLRTNFLYSYFFAKLRKKKSFIKSDLISFKKIKIKKKI